MPGSSSSGLRRAPSVVLEVAAVGVGALILAFVVLQLWSADLQVPFSYVGGDGIFNLMLIKGTLQNGWFLHNPDIGFPLGQNLLDYPSSADNLHFVAFRILGLGSKDPAVVLNLFYLLTYPVTAMTAYVVFRLMRRERATAVVFALLFTFLPYHLFRNENHVFLSAYQSIPLTCLLLYWVFQPTPVLLEASGRFRIRRSKRALAAVVIALLLGAMGVYYGVFALALLTAAGGVGLVAGWGWRRALSSVAIAAIVGASLVANLSPSIVHRLTHGTNNEVTHQKVEFSEWFGLKIGQLVLPVQGHRVKQLASLQAKSYNPVQPSEGAQQLGAVGAAGFLGLLLWSFVRIVRRPDITPVDDEVKPWAFSTLVSLLVAAVGGFSLVIAVAGFTEIRSWNRISLIIAFASYAFVSLWLERAVTWLKRRRPSDMRIAVALAVALPVFFAGALLEQTTSAALPNYAASKQAFLRDRAFVREVEARLPRGAGVFQLPYIPFPEEPPRFAMADYDHVRAYVHSRDLRWSYGEVKGRNGNWQNGAASLPVEQMIPALIGAGFSAIWIDGFGYEDGGAKATADLIEWAGPPTLTSGGGRYRVFDLRTARARLGAKPVLDRVKAAGEAALRPIIVSYARDWEPSVYVDGHTQRTASKPTEMTLDNSLDHSRSVTLRFLAKGDGPAGSLSVAAPGVNIAVNLKATLSPAAVKFVLPPGQSVVRFDAPGRFTIADVTPEDDAIAAAKLVK